MIDYKFKEGDWFSTEGLTEDEVKMIAEEIYQQGFPDCFTCWGWGKRSFKDEYYTLFHSDNTTMFGNCCRQEVENHVDTQEILKQIREAQMEKQTDNIEIKAGQTYRKTQKGEDDNAWWDDEPVGLCMVTHHEDCEGDWWDEEEEYFINEYAVKNGWVELVEDPTVSFDLNNWYLETEGLTEDHEKIICYYLVSNYKKGFISNCISQGECLCWDYVGVKDGEYEGADHPDPSDSTFEGCEKITYEQFEVLVSKDNQEGDKMEQTDNSVLTLDDKSNRVKQLKENLQAAQQRVSDIENELKESEEDLRRSVMEVCGVSVSVPTDSEEKINDYENWKVGDQVKCLADWSGYFTEGKVYKIEKLDLTDPSEPVYLDNGYWTEFENGDEFIKVI